MIKKLVLLLLLLGTLFAQEKELEKVTLQLHWKYQFEFAGFIAAKEKGFYRDVGLDVELKEYEFGMNVEQDVLDGTVEYGIYNSLSLLEYLRGKPIRLVASFFKRAALVLVTQPDIKSPLDLVGKKIMASTKEDFILNYQPYFDGYGIKVDDVELVPHSYGIEEFARGEVDDMTAFVSNELCKLDDKGIKYNVLDPSDENLYVLQLELITSEDEIKNHTKRVAAFKAASIKGWQYALQHKDELINIIYDKYTNKIPKSAILKEAIGVEKLILPYTYDIGSIDKNFLNKQIKLFKEYYNVGFDKNIENFLFKNTYEIKKIHFTPEEQKYIKDHPTIELCLQYDQFPVDGYVDGKFVGIMSDIYKIISGSTSLHFNPVVSNSSQELKENLDSKKCQLLSVYANKNRTYETILPTKTFATTHFTFISKLDKSFVNNPKALKGKILLTELEAFRDYLKYLYPYLTIEVENDKNKMIKTLFADKAYAIITLDEQADYVIDKYGYGKLKINGFLGKDHLLEASIGVQKDEPVLRSIIQKALDEISPQRVKSITNSWRINRYKESFDYALFWKLLILAVAIFLVMAYYQRKLRHFNATLEEQVNLKTSELKKLNESLEITVQDKIKELINKDKILTTQSKQAVMGEMISMIAHQWRQPLSTITLQISNLQLKRMMGEKISEESIDEIMDNVSDRIIYLSNTIDDFQTYFRPDRVPVEISVREFIDKVITLGAARIDTSSAHVNILCYESQMVKIYVNELIQVVLNILNNAIDALEQSKKEMQVVNISCRFDKEFIYIDIEDNANGISEENLKNIFDPYFSTKGRNGTGLGLYMSQMIIEKQFKGAIDVETSEEGTTFTVKISKDLE